MSYQLTPPFEIYRECDIADDRGHICTAENREIAEAILIALHRAVQWEAERADHKAAIKHANEMMKAT